MMQLSWLDIGIFLVFVSFVVGTSLYKSRQKKETTHNACFRCTLLLA